MTPGFHVVALGDHLSRVAARFGFRSYQPIWDDAANRELKEARSTPHILAVGDEVEIPSGEPRVVRGTTGQRIEFVASLPALVVRLELARFDWSTLDAEQVVVQVDGLETPTTKVADGVIEFPVGPMSDRVLVWHPDREWVGRIGFLQPIDTVAGYRERLTNLGYRAGRSEDPADRQLRSAVEEFQCDQQLSVDGAMGPVTRERLHRVHGC